MLKERPCVLIMRSMARIGVHDELSVRQVLSEDERINRLNHNIF